MNNSPKEIKKRVLKDSVPKPIRKIATAMAAERPAKEAVRNLWLAETNEFLPSYNDEDVPLYVTLPGNEALDIKLLIDSGIITLTETGAISASDQHIIVAVERNLEAVRDLQKKLPGLKILNQDFAAIIRGHELVNFPDSDEHKKICCAKVLNLDLQGSLEYRDEAGGPVFPLFNWIEKISILHAKQKPNLDWSLLLTLNADIRKSETAGVLIQNFLKENFVTSPDFQESCLAILGENVQDQITNEAPFNLEELSREEIQKILMIFVPKKISRIVHQRWQVSTVWNLCYGGADDHAPMVTWVLRFKWDDRAPQTPQAVYVESLNQILIGAGHITDDGQIAKYN